MKGCNFTPLVFMDVTPGVSINQAASELEEFCKHSRVSVMTKFNGARLLIEYSNPKSMANKLIFDYEYWLEEGNA